MSSLISTRTSSVFTRIRVLSRILNQLEGCSKLTSYRLLDGNTYQSACFKTTAGPCALKISSDNWMVKAPCVLPSPSWSWVRTYAKSKNKGKDKMKSGKGQKKVQLTSDQLEGVVDMDRVGQDLDKVLEDLKDKFIHQVTVRTSQGVFDNLTVKTADGNFPLIQLGQVVQKSPQLVVINMASAPQYISNVKESFMVSGLNINPQQDGTSLFVAIPKVTREHREGLVKNAKMLSEKSKKQIRDVFSKYSKKIKTVKEGHSVDDLRAADNMVKDLMQDTLKQVDAMTDLKCQELMGGK